MNKQNIRVRKTVTDLDRAITNHSAVLGGQVRKGYTQDFMFDFLYANTHRTSCPKTPSARTVASPLSSTPNATALSCIHSRFNKSVHDLTAIVPALRGAKAYLLAIVAVLASVPMLTNAQVAILQPVQFSESVRANVRTTTLGVLRGLHYGVPDASIKVEQLAVVLPPGDHAQLCLTIETQDGRYFAEATYAVAGLTTPQRYRLQLQTDHSKLLKKYSVRDVAVLAFLAQSCRGKPKIFLPVTSGNGGVESVLIVLVNTSTPGVDARVFYRPKRRYFDCARDEATDRLIAFDTECLFTPPANKQRATLTLVRDKYGHQLNPLNFNVYIP